MLQQKLRQTPNAVCVCIDQGAPPDLSGRLYHRYSQQALAFYSAQGLLAAMEALFDEWDYPQHGVRMRSFGAAPPRRGGEPLMAKRPIGEPKGHTGRAATFVVHVMYRQNATWQGEVTWAEENKSSCFRSALELIKLIDSAVEQTAPPQGEKPPKTAAP